MERRAHGRAGSAGPARPADARSPRLGIVEDRLDGLRVLAVAGELDVATAPGLCVQLDRARRTPAPAIVVDLSGVEFCDSAGLRALIGAGHEYAAAGGEMAVVEPARGSAARLFTMTGAREFLSLYGTREDAVRARSPRRHERS